ncbi:MAG: DedA family protein [Pseudomonadota bacterium]
MTAEADPTTFAQFIEFVRQNIEWVPPIVFALGFAESLVVVSVFVPSTALFLAIGGAHSAAGGEFLPVWIAGSVGAVIGDVVSFAIGRLLKEDIHKTWPFSKAPDTMKRGRYMFRRYGVLTIIVGKFLGNLRPVLPIAAGAMRMPWAQFLPASIASCIIWAGVFLAPGYGLFQLLS